MLSHAALAVAPDLPYVRTEDGFVLAEARMAAVLGEDARVAERFHGRDILGTRYEPPFDFIATEEFGPKGHTVLPGDFVSADDGTGLVHTSISFGEDDYRLGQEQGIAVINPVRLDGTYEERMGPYAGRWVKEADADIVEDLRERGRLLRAETYLHAYPHCWRCGTPLLYYAKPSWYIGTSKLRDRLLAANETVDWHPEHIKHGRFGRWLENNVDWAISRERYWGTPLPVWRCENGHAECMGSLAELAERSGEALEDPHRPYVDTPSWPCGDCGEPMRRVPEVIDVWFDSGCMPFAQHHAPFENQEHFERNFPANYICEAIDQTRGWFYSLIAVSTLLFDRSPYETVLCLGHIADPEGKKMSKSLGNIVPPWEVIDRHGADAFRWYFLTSKQPWDGYLFSTETVGESVRQLLLQLWNTYGFYVLYANVNDVTERAGPATELDRWALSRLAATVAEVARAPRRTTTPRAPARRSRRSSTTSRTGTCAARAGASGTATRPPSGRCTPASSRSRSCSPRSRRSSPTRSTTTSTAPSRACTCATGPRPAGRDEALEFDMGVARETVGLGLSARSQSKLKVRQPLRAAVVVAADRERAALERLGDVVREELNVKEIRYVAQADDLGSYEIKPNYRSLGPRFGKLMPQVAAAVESLDPAHVAAAVRAGTRVGVSVDGHDHDLGPDDLQLAMKPLDGYQLEREGSHAVALELQLDDELRPRGAGARGRPRGPERAQGRGPRGRGPHRAAPRRRRRAARRRTCLRALPHGRDAGADGGLRRRRQRGGRHHRRPGAADRGGSRLGQRGLELGLEALLGHRALDPLGLRAVAEEHHGRDREDLVVHRGLLILVDVELDDLQLGALARDLLEDGGDDAAGTAPRRPEVDQHGLLGLEHLGLEVGVGHVLNVGHRWWVLSGSLRRTRFKKYSEGSSGCGRGQPASATSTRGETQASMAAATKMIGIAIATVTKVAASSSFQAFLRAAIVQAASGRKSANSSGTACGARPRMQHRGRDVQPRREGRRGAAERPRLGGEREQRGGHDEADRQRAGLVVDPAPGAGVALGDLGQRRAGHEPGHAGEAVERQHEAVAVEDEAEVAERGVVGEAGEVDRGQVGRRVDGDDPRRAEQQRGDRERAEGPGHERVAGADLPASQRRAGVGPSLDQGHVLRVHASRFGIYGREDERSVGTTHAASSAIRRVIFDVPPLRSRNTIGISTTRRPRCSARWVSSIWKA